MINRKISFTILNLIFLLTSILKAGTGVYTFTTGTGGSLTTMTGSTQLIASATDDGVSTVTNIGFTFAYAGCNSYTQFSVNSNGLMRLGSTVVSNQWTNGIANGADDGKLVPYWDDISTGSNASGSKVHYLLSGSAPNRILTVEWLVSVPLNTASAYNGRFQVQLYETSNIIKYVYGTVPTGNSYSVGMAVSSSDYISITTASHTASSSSINDAQTTALVSGRYYTFTPTSYTASARTFQATTSNVTKCSTGQAILAIQVTTTSCSSTLTELQINMTGSTSATSDVTKIHVYYTGSSSSFMGVTKFDGNGTTPANGTITITGSQALNYGDNFFWVAYDINTSATTNNLLDGQCTRITFDGSNYTPSVTAPSGSRTIVTCPTTTIASYALTSNLADATGTYANVTKTGSATGPTASGVCNNGTYGSTNTYTPSITGLNSTNFQISFEIAVNSFSNYIFNAGSGYRWIGVYINGSGEVKPYYNNFNFIPCTKTISIGTYYTYKIVYTSGLFQLYLDGHLISEATIPSPLTTNGERDFSTNNGGSGSVLNGCMRNLVISNTPNTIASFTVLPVELLGFDLVCRENHAQINWKTATETNNNFFSLERSTDGVHFSSVATIDGAGNSLNVNSYSYTDHTLMNNNIVYYQLHQTDYDGNVKKLASKALVCNDEKNVLDIVSLIQDGDSYQLNFVSSDHNYDHLITVYDLQGKIIYNQNISISENYNNVKMPSLNGYKMVIIVINNNSNTSTRKFIVN